MLSIQTRVVTDFQQNAKLLVDTETNQSVLIDPGGDVDVLVDLVTQSGSELQQLVLTHSHIDHCAGVVGFREKFDADLPLLGHEVEQVMRESIAQQARMFGLNPDEFPNCPEPTEYIDGDDTLNVGGLTATALFTPGHSPGHLAFYFESLDWNLDGQAGSSPVLVAGDALFQGSIGRTDLPGGNHRQLIESINNKLMTLPDETIVLCGHGPETTIGQERRTNPFL